jgi:ribonucleoside-diphosphate reductase beta chain
MLSLTKTREVFKPFEYPKAHEFWEKQQNNHWLPSEVSMSKDIQDWKNELTESERKVLGNVLNSFTQTEIHVNEYWSTKVSKWFPKPEIQLMCSAFASMESIHQVGYAYLNDTLGLDDYSAFMEDPTAVSKLDYLKTVKGNSKTDIARSLAIFSAFTEGVNLFSSFAILTGLSRYNLLMGLKNIVAWSQLDEQLHSQAGCWLFNTFIKENPQIFTDELKKDLYDAARLAVQLEDDFIDQSFSLGVVRGLDPKDLKQYIRHRANSKLYEIGLKANWKNIDQDALARMEWFNNLSGGISNVDFFSSRETQYSKVNFNIDNLFEEK